MPKGRSTGQQAWPESLQAGSCPACVRTLQWHGPCWPKLFGTL
ncbi:hypothetical protein WN944_001460 [Citrus x changshan-huyou]|uniref:Uncharacterized protein n=1 Tax=Citrus x changshan-huyou TaxID=2935761 RepID=A0AAP0QR82_9ROSI